jgi:16S rRNA (guanine966-N2)-methyltransferase
MGIGCSFFEKNKVFCMTQGQVRIIGGKWRGRKLKVPVALGLRPTPDRVRETLFNWLAPVIAGAYCLDAFAGSGILGFEALSRGAAYTVMTDQSAVVVRLLQQEAKILKVQAVEIYCALLPQQLKKSKKLFDIVFLDPPYQDNLLLLSCWYLEEHGFLAKEAYIYLEAKDPLKQSDLPPHWRLLKSKKAGQVAYHLAQRLL